MAQLVEDLDRPAPRGPRGIAVARGPVRVAEAQQGHRHLVTVAEVVPQREGTLVTGDRLAVVTELVVRVPEAVPGVGVTRPVTGVLVQGQRLVAVLEGLLVVSELAVV